MSKLSKAVSAQRENNSLRRDETVTNFMGGEFYIINPLDTLKMIMASSIFGEPSYYRDSDSNNKCATKYQMNELVRDASVLPSGYEGLTTNQIMEKAIDAALDYDFYETVCFAVTLRKIHNMRLNPQIIMVRAAIHPKRKEFTKSSPSSFDKINNQVMQRPDEAITQMAYYLYLNGGKKNNIPSILKRSWAKKMSSYDRYAVSKYKNHEIGMINGVRLCHAHSDVINELMTTGTVTVDKEEKTWEQYRSAGYDWRWIIDNCNMSHMAMLRNLRGVFTEINDSQLCKKYMDKLLDGVKTGKQFPFRYWSAMKAIEESDCSHKTLILDRLRDCMERAIENYPKLKGKTMCLSDNSGSAWGAFNSEYGSVTVAEIDNLSSVITARCSDEGYVGKFGDKLKIYPISKRDSVLSQATKVNETGGADVGHATEGGIWEFFKQAIKNKEHWDNIFIYSDCQAGHGELFGTKKQLAEYKDKYGFGWDLDYINVFALIQEYRKKVNPKVNVFCVQTAGYNNALIPEYAYRTNILYGWTGREAEFAAKMIDQWDEIDAEKELGGST